ncbi:MAG: TetR/AcrR family transcriptional regulator [Pseudomonadota bacterium]
MGDLKTSYHHGDLRRAVVDCASRKIQADGADKLSLRGCAREIGVDPAAIYQHFKSKEAILEEIARIAFADLANLMETETAAAGADSRARLLSVGAAYVAFARAHPKLFALMFKVSGAATSGATRGVSSMGRDPYRILTDAWSDFAGDEADEVSPIALWSAVHGMAELLISGFGPEEDAEVTTLIEEVCASMIDGRKVRAAGVVDADETP